MVQGRGCCSTVGRIVSEKGTVLSTVNQEWVVAGVGRIIGGGAVVEEGC